MESETEEYVCWYCGCNELTQNKSFWSGEQWECAYCHNKTGERSKTTPAFFSMYDEDLEVLKNERFLKGEIERHKYNCSFFERFGYVVITNLKLYAVSFSPDQGSIFRKGGERYEFTVINETAWNKLQIIDMYQAVTEAKTVIAVDDELTNKEIISKWVIEVPLGNISGINLQEHRSKSSKWFSSIRPNILGSSDIPGMQYFLFHPVHLGVAFYKDLNRAIRPDRLSDSLTADSVQLANEYQARLGALEILYRVKKMITEEEYQEKRKEILELL